MTSVCFHRERSTLKMGSVLQGKNLLLGETFFALKPDPTGKKGKTKQQGCFHPIAIRPIYLSSSLSKILV